MRGENYKTALNKMKRTAEKVAFYEQNKNSYLAFIREVCQEAKDRKRALQLRLLHDYKEPSAEAFGGELVVKHGAVGEVYIEMDNDLYSVLKAELHRLIRSTVENKVIKDIRIIEFEPR